MKRDPSELLRDGLCSNQTLVKEGGSVWGTEGHCGQEILPGLDSLNRSFLLSRTIEASGLHHCHLSLLIHLRKQVPAQSREYRARKNRKRKPVVQQ